MEEISKHSPENGIWLVYEDLVLDVSKWYIHHPGSPKTILRFAGKDCTDEIRQMHYDFVIDNKLKHFVIGKVSNPIQPNKIQLEFRELYQKFHKLSYFEYNDLSFYVKKLMLYIPILLLSIYCIRSLNLISLGAILMGIFLLKWLL